MNHNGNVAVFGLSLHPECNPVIKSALQRTKQPYVLTTALETESNFSPSLLLCEKGAGSRVMKAMPIIEALTGNGLIVASDATPKAASEYLHRNLTLIAATQCLLYVVDPLSSVNLDLTVHLTFARIIGATSIGILPKDSRLGLDTTQLTLTDAIVGEVEPRALTALLLSLKGEPSK